MVRIGPRGNGSDCRSEPVRGTVGGRPHEFRRTAGWNHPCGGAVAASVIPVMLLIFVLWAVTYVGIFLHKRWTIPMAVVSILYTLAMLRYHMTDPIPLSF